MKNIPVILLYAPSTDGHTMVYDLCISVEEDPACGTTSHSHKRRLLLAYRLLADRSISQSRIKKPWVWTDLLSTTFKRLLLIKI